VTVDSLNTLPKFLAAALIWACSPAPRVSAASAASASGTASAAARMSQAGPEQSELMTQVGQWAVVATLWPAPTADPIVTRGLVAERTMIGPILQEIMRPAPQSWLFVRYEYTRRRD
jgi:hypothetical protein